MKRLNLAVYFMVMFFSAQALSQQKANTEIMVTKDGYAIYGYDPVSYFTAAGPSKGDPAITTDWRGATWLFSTSENREAFLQEPDRYAPEYGGWCAYGMAKGYAAETDPLNAWTIHNNKLYLNWDEKVSRKWNKKLGKYLSKSEANWPDVQGDLQQGEAEIYWKEDQ